MPDSTPAGASIELHGVSKHYGISKDEQVAAHDMTLTDSAPRRGTKLESRLPRRSAGTCAVPVSSTATLSWPGMTAQQFRSHRQEQKRSGDADDKRRRSWSQKRQGRVSGTRVMVIIWMAGSLAAAMRTI
jgi:hypothetical protein